MKLNRIISFSTQLSQGLIVMIRRLFILSVMGAVAVPAAAASYSAKLSTPVSGHVVARDINWACAGDSCQGNTADSRPAVICQGLVKRTGKVESFLVDGRAFSDADLAKRNASSKAEASKALAAQ